MDMETRIRSCVGLAAAGLLTLCGTAAAQSTARATSASTAKAKTHALDPFLKTAEKSRKTLNEIDDYTAIFRKMEIVRGKAYRHTMSMKFRSEPFSVYLYFLEGHKGQQVLYVSGENRGKLLARAPGLGGFGITVALDPKSPKAMEEGKFPITKIGMANMLDSVIEQWKDDRHRGEVKVTYYPDAKLQRRGTNLQPMECKVLQSSHPKVRQGVEYYMTRLYIDKKTNLPVRVEQYGFPRRAGGKPPLLAEYTYWNVRTNVGLKDIDFDPKNPRYKF